MAHSVSSSGTTFIAPVYGDLILSGSASVTTLQQVSVTMNYDSIYKITLDASDSKLLLRAFKMSGAGSSFTVGWRDTTGDQFKGIMRKIIDNAKKEGTTTTLSQVLDDGITNQFISAFKNLLPNILETGYTFSTGVDSLGAAGDMRDKLTDGPREVIAQQIPTDHYAIYMDASENPTTDALPLLVGDKLVFIFDTKQNLVVTLDPTKTPGVTSDTLGVATGAVTDLTGATSAAGDNPYGASLYNTAYSFDKQLIAFEVTVSGAVGETAKIAAINSVGLA